MRSVGCAYRGPRTRQAQQVHTLPFRSGVARSHYKVPVSASVAICNVEN